MQKNFWVRTAILGVFVVVAAYVLYVNLTLDDKNPLKRGDQAPNFVYTNLEGESVELTSLRGKAILINFWGTWCKPCEREMPYLQKQYEAYQSEGLEIIGINIGESSLVVSNFVEQYNLTFQIGIDRDSQIQVAYGVNPLPASFFIDRKGNIQRIVIGQMSEQQILSYIDEIIVER